MKDCILIILAAGKSSRMGFPKGLLKFKDDYFLEAHLKSFALAGGKKAIIIFGSGYEQYQKGLSWMPSNPNDEIQFKNLDVNILINHKSHLGQFSSLLLGTRFFLNSKYKGAFILPVDTPPPMSGTWKILKEKLIDPFHVITPKFKEKGGHPILMAKSFAQGLVKNPPEAHSSRLDWIIKKTPANNKSIIEINDPSLTLNINTPTEFKETFDKFSL